MGHSRNPALVNRELPHLKELLAGHPCQWHVDPPERSATEAFQRRLWQALSIARANPEQFPELAQAAARFSLHYIRPGLIEARPKSDGTKSVAQSATPISSGAVQGRIVATVGMQNALDIVAAWDEHLPSSDPLNFPRTTLSTEELTRLYHWAKSNVPKLMILVGSGMITVSLMEAGAEAIEWKPVTVPSPAELELENEEGLDL